MRSISLVVAAFALAGCAGVESSPTTTYIRADGQPVVQEQLEADKSSCSPSGAKSYDCMIGKGYFLVSVQDAEIKQAQLAQAAAEKKKQEEARIAEELKRQQALERAARRQAKKKKKPPAQAVN
jgi:hypothetical protein